MLNSSVTSSALNDIQKNAADSVAQQYQNNISTVSGLANQQNNNTQSANNANAGLYGDLINSAGTGITTAAAAQEAAQTPAINLWNASLGLNGSTTGALAAAAGKGTTTSTQTQSTSGGGGLLSGLLAGAASSYGTLWCFPAGTRVTMSDGTQKNIEHIHGGDKVKTNASDCETVIDLVKPHYSDVYAVVTDGNHITNTTLTQPIMKSDGTYVLLSDITLGTELMNVGKVSSIVYSGERRVYDLHVSGDNTYIVDGGFVAKGGDGPWPEQ